MKSNKDFMLRIQNNRRLRIGKRNPPRPSVFSVSSFLTNPSRKASVGATYQVARAQLPKKSTGERRSVSSVCVYVTRPLPRSNVETSFPPLLWGD